MEGKTLIITEKPNVAERIAKSLSSEVKKRAKGGIAYYEIEEGFVAPAVGHIFTLSEEEKKQIWSYPVFNTKWTPIYEIEKNADYARKYAENIEFLAKKADVIINACDYDIEGSVIGFNVIKYICKRDPFKSGVKRMKFSTLTKESIIDAYKNMTDIDKGMVEAGLTRHTLDWYWGINMSRALTLSVKKANIHTVLSIGRVQGPTLKVIVDKEREINAFVSRPYWEIKMKVAHEGAEITANHIRDKFWDKNEVDPIKNKLGDKATVSDIVKTKTIQKPLPPFDLTTLQTEAYRNYHISPQKTLDIAQALYTQGLISYPRTSSQRLPFKQDYFSGILKGLSRIEEYGKLAEKLLMKKTLKPKDGKKEDPAHPAIHPTGEVPEQFEIQQRKIYDLIVRRFLSAFGDDAVRENIKIEFDNNGEVFVTKGSRTIEQGWHAFYGKYAKFEEEEIPKLEKGAVLPVVGTDVEEKETSPPKRYTPASVVKEMESLGIGTKSTRGAIVETLYRRGYITGESIEATEMGRDVVAGLEMYAPEVLSENLTKRIEKEMEYIREDRKTKEDVIEEGRKIITKISEKFKHNEMNIGKKIGDAFLKTKKSSDSFGKCLGCKIGDLVMRKGPHGAFIGCSNYPKCRYTLSLPKGMIKKEGLCQKCGYPIIKIIYRGKRPWIFCINPTCPSRKAKEESDHIKP